MREVSDVESIGGQVSNHCQGFELPDSKPFKTPENCPIARQSAGRVKMGTVIRPRWTRCGARLWIRTERLFLSFHQLCILQGEDPRKVYIKVMPVGLSKGHDGGSCGPHSTRLQNTKWNPSLFKCVGHACSRQWPPDDSRVRLVGPVKREDR